MAIVVVVAIGLTSTLLAAAVAVPAYGSDPVAGLNDAEARAAEAETEIEELEAQLGPVESAYAVSVHRAAPARRAARSSRARVRDLKNDEAAGRQSAAAEISRIEARHAQEVDDHDEQVKGGVGLALAALVAAAIALGWSWFRASAAVALLTRLPRGQAAGLCIGVGMVLLIVGAAMAGSGKAVGAIGTWIALLGLLLPVAFLLARHSAQVQRGRSEPLLKRERVPASVTRGISAVLLVVCVAGFGAAIFASDPEPVMVSAALRDRAGGVRGEAAKRRLAGVEAEATRLREKAAKLSADQGAARAALRDLRGQLHGARRQLARAHSDARHFTRRLAAISAREAREAEELAEIEAEEAEELEEEAGAGCDPNYTGCVPNTGYDVDCAEVGGPVEVIGTDVDGLDADGDGIGCE